MDLHPAYRKLAISVGLLALVFSVGVGGYMVLEGWSFEDASFMTVITVATVGYGEVRPLDHAGRWFTMVLILGGMGTILYALSSLTAFVVEGEFRDLLRRSKMSKQIGRLDGHYIVCGAGRVGTCILAELVKTGNKVVLVDQEASKLEPWGGADPNVLTIQGDATSDAVLEAAAVRRAKGLLASLHADKDNLFVVLSARALNPNLRLVARADEEASRDKLVRAGADAVVFPHTIGGLRMASQMLRPNVVDFLDTMLREKTGTLRVDEARVAAGSELEGRTVGEANIPLSTGAVLLALRRPDRRFEFNPSPDRKLEPGDTLVVVGEMDQLKKLRHMAGEP